MKINTKTRFGVRLLLDLALNHEQGAIQISEISKRQDISAKYLEQIIRPLKRANLVVSLRGPKGGYLLHEKPEEITLGQVFRIFEGPVDLIECLNAPEKCDKVGKCRVRPAWQKAIKAFYDTLNTITIADLLVDASNEGVCNRHNT